MNRHTYYGVWRHIWRHMMRATVKSILVILVALAIFLTQGWLQETINRNEIEINRLYETRTVSGQILLENSFHMTEYRAGNVIRRRTIDDIIATDIMIEIYFEATAPWTFVTNPDVDLVILNEILDEFAGDGNDFDSWQHSDFLDELIAIEQLAPFINRHAFTPTTQVPGASVISIDIEIEFASGFDQDSFVYTDENLETPVPIILSERIMMRNGFELGDTVSIGYDLNQRPASWQQMPAVIIGMHQHEPMIQDILLPLSAWEFAQGDNIGFRTLEFTIDPRLNSELPAIQESIEEIIRRFGAGFEPLMLDLLDEEIRFVVQTLELNVSLLRLLYPVVVVVSMMIAIALSFFLTLQNTKNVAVMRIFGATRKKVGLLLWIEQIILCLSGLILGLCFLIALGWGGSVLELLGIAGLYLLSVMIGSAFGIFIIIRHAPLELLQVKE